MALKALGLEYFLCFAVVVALVWWPTGTCQAAPVQASTSSPPGGDEAQATTEKKGPFPVYPWVKQVHLVFMTHLDLGFTNLVANVCREYFYNHIPAAITTSQTLRKLGRPERFIYTSHPWLLLEYLDNGAGCLEHPRTEMERQLLESAIASGDVTWHAKPMNLLPEAADASLFGYGLTLAEQLDNRFNKAKKIAASSKDVPGISRSVIPIMAKHGVKALHIGVNPACVGAAAPSVFRWQYGGNELLVMLHQGEPIYGGNITIPDYPEALVYSFNLDNQPPLNYTEVIQFYQYVQEQYPNAVINATSLDLFAENMMNNRTLMSMLPRLTQEMGDTWLYGIAADPYRLSAFRELSRLRKSLEEQINTKLYSEKPEAALVHSFSRRLMKIPEHNWGLSTSTYLHNYTYFLAWNNTIFRQNRSNDDLSLLDFAWREQRSFLLNVSTFLTDVGTRIGRTELAVSLSKNIDLALESLKPQIPDLSHGWNKLSRDGTYETNHFVVGFDAGTGAINYLLEKKTNTLWSTPKHKLAAFLYQTYNESDFDYFNRYYTPNCVPCPDFNKIGMWDSGHTERKDYQPKLLALWRKGQQDSFLLQLALPPEAQEKYGAPAQVTLALDFEVNNPSLAITVQWFEKQATRLAEAMWLSFTPNTDVVTNPEAWVFDVMGSPVSPYDVMINGSRHLHAVESGVSYAQGNVFFSIETLDAALVAPGDTNHLLNFAGSEQPQLENGIHVNLFNNLWGTAFNQWYEDDAKFRFILRFGSS